MKRIVIDLDDTLTVAGVSDYPSAPPRPDVISQLRHYKAMGFEITIFTARNMRTYAGDVDKIRLHTLPIIIQWLADHDVPYDEIIVGKPWCGNDGFYVDDKAIRPDEFVNMSYDDIRTLLGMDKAASDIGQ